MDGAEFILVFIAIKQSMKAEQLAEKSQLFKGYSKKSSTKKMANFEFFKGFPLCILAKFAHFEYLLEKLLFLSKF